MALKNYNKAVIVTGTPGTGKTTFAKALANEAGFEYVDVMKLIRKHNLSSGYDKKKKCAVVCIGKLNKYLIHLIKGSKKTLVIDSHLSHFLPKKYVAYCIVCKCELKELKKRLILRRYNKAKIRENLDAEIFDVSRTETEEAEHKLIIVDTSVKKPLNLRLKKQKK